MPLWDSPRSFISVPFFKLKMLLFEVLVHYNVTSSLHKKNISKESNVLFCFFFSLWFFFFDNFLLRYQQFWKNKWWYIIWDFIELYWKTIFTCLNAKPIILIFIYIYFFTKPGFSIYLFFKVYIYLLKF